MFVLLDSILSRYKIFKEKPFVFSFIFTIVALIASSYIGYYATIYATEKMSSPVTDIILSNIRVYDVDTIFVYGPWIFWLLVALFLVFKPYRIPFTVKSIALFVIILDVVSVSYFDNAGGRFAHLGGALAGYFLAGKLKRGRDWLTPVQEWLSRGKSFFGNWKRSKLRVAHRSNEANASFADNARQQKRMDEILDKISRSGYENLSREEKDFLFKISRD